MVATAIAIRMESKGPVLFRQKRYGFNNEVIDVLKFRSMYHEMADPLAKKVVTKNDPRVTRVGRFIRRTSIDELPQLFNVLRGTDIDTSVCALVMCRCAARSMVYDVAIYFNSFQRVNRKIGYDKLRGVLDPGPSARTDGPRDGHQCPQCHFAGRVWVP